MRKFVFPFVLLSLSGCIWPFDTGSDDPKLVQATADFSYSNAARLGTFNSGLHEVGSVFLWNSDPSVNSMTYLTTVDLRPVGSLSFGGNREEQFATGFGLTVESGDLQEFVPSIRAGISSQTKMIATGLYRQNYDRVISALAKYVTDLELEGIDADRVVMSKTPDMRLVVVKTAVFAETVELGIGGATNDDGEKPRLAFSIGDEDDPIVQVDLTSSSKVKCNNGSENPVTNLANRTGTSVDQLSTNTPVCFFSVDVFDPTYVSGNPNMQFERITGGSLNLLPDGFRSIR